MSGNLEMQAASTAVITGVCYQTHVQNISWQNQVCNSQTAGTTGQSLQMEAIKISLQGAPTGGNICCTAEHTRQECTRRSCVRSLNIHFFRKITSKTAMNRLKRLSMATSFAGLTALLTVMSASSAQAAAFTSIRLGDIDGFGYGNGAGFYAANGGSANVDGVGVLGTGDFLPDLNRNGVVATTSGDDFDNRSAAEISGTFLTGSGFIDRGSTGSEFTDIALSTSFRSTFPNPKVNPFPGDGDPSTTSGNQPGFTFDFFVNSADIIAGVPLYFNLVFGDYDVVPAEVTFTRADGSTFTEAVTQQPNTQDGLIQAAFVELNFNDVFTASEIGFNGFLGVDFNAPNEPYTAFDFSEISTSQISVPEPSTLSLLAFGPLGAGFFLKRKKQ